MQLTHIQNKTIDSILKLERKKKFGLTNLKRFLKLVKNPEKSLKIIHVAGTNGKGSVCAMIESALIHAGYKVGMFTSPHLIKFNERIRINDDMISSQDIEKISKKISQTEKKHKIKLTFFETAAAMAFIYFNENNVDHALMETGMGGRLDATNVSQPVVSIITNIGLEHTDVLGNTLKEIAKEKAGIIKENTTVITSAKGIALNIIEKISKKHNSELIIAKRIKKIPLHMKGTYQIENASTATAVLRHRDIPEKYILSGIKKAFWPGRFEFIKKNVLLDCAHNPDGVKALINSLKALKYKKLTMIISIMKDKDCASMCEKLSKLDASFILTKTSVSRAAEPKELAKYFSDPLIIPDIKQAIAHAKSIAKRKDLILITGSIYFIGEVYGLV